MRPEETEYAGSSENLPRVWVAVRAAVREVVDETTLADVLSGKLPAHIKKLTTLPDAWQPR
jgi:DNA-binding IscR family transcriptional regulator